jgi:SAM-dependent methyltransferase
MEIKKITKFLEIGIGNDSPYYFKKYFPFALYHCVDKNLKYNFSKESFKAFDKFYKIDLEKNSLNIIHSYDYIIIAHVIEHIENGEGVIGSMIRKLKSNGRIYMEYPRKASVCFQSMKGTLNFYDDPTHKRFYEKEVLEKILMKNGFVIKKSGIKRDFSRILGLPYMIFNSLISLVYIRGSVFWDLLGFAEFI